MRREASFTKYHNFSEIGNIFLLVNTVVAKLCNDHFVARESVNLYVLYHHVRLYLQEPVHADDVRAEVDAQEPVRFSDHDQLREHFVYLDKKVAHAEVDGGRAGLDQVINVLVGAIVVSHAGNVGLVDLALLLGLVHDPAVVEQNAARGEAALEDFQVEVEIFVDSDTNKVCLQRLRNLAVKFQFQLKVLRNQEVRELDFVLQVRGHNRPRSHDLARVDEGQRQDVVELEL